MTRFSRRFSFFYIGLVLCAWLGAHPSAQATFNATGFVTPHTLRITVLKASLIKEGNSQTQIFSGTFNADFQRSGSNLVAIPLTTIAVPEGRYVGVSVTFKEKWEVKLDGNKYYGATGNGLTDGSTVLYTTSGGIASDNDAVTTTAGTAQFATQLGVPGTSGCSGECSSQTYFARVVCVGATSSACGATDEYFGTATGTRPDLNIVLDLYQSVYVDSANKSLAKSNVYPFAVFGTPGAALHLARTNGSGGYANVSMIFSSDKQLQSVTMNTSSMSVGGSGGNYVTATSVPSGSVSSWPVRPYEFSSTTGQLKFPMGDCPSSTCTSRGLATLDNVLRQAGTTVAYTCTSDATGALGYGYSGGDCSTVPASASYVMTRIIDPTNVFDICGPTKTGYIAGSGGTGTGGGGGTCAASGTDSDGYR